MGHAVAGISHWMALGPLAWLGGLRLAGRPRDRGYWFLAAAFAVSVLADSVAHWVDPLVVSVVYLGAQAGLIGIVLLPRWQAAGFALLLTVTGLAALALQPAAKRDVLQHTIAWLGVSAVVLNRWELGKVRTALLVAFVPLWASWMWYCAAWPSYPAGYTFQAMRAVGLLAVCWSAWRVEPSLRIAR